MAIMIDGLQKVRYAAPKAYSQPVRYSASNMLTQQQQAAANRYQAQANQYKKSQQVQVPPTPTAAQRELERIALANTKPTPQSQKSQQATANRYSAQAGMYFNQNQSTTKPYDPIKNPIGYRNGTLETTRYLQNTYGMDWRQQPQFSGILMNSSEWLKRRAAWEKNYGNIFVSQDEWTRRNNAAPPGYMWTPFGSSYARLNTTPTTNTTPSNNGGSYASNPPYYSGGGGGGSYTPKPPEWWVEMVQWRI